MSRQKLELTWIGKDEKLEIEPRILIEDKSLSNTSQDENTENMLIHGDNLLALKALETEYAGQVKCIYIDRRKSPGSRPGRHDPGRYYCAFRPCRLSFQQITLFGRAGWRY